MHISPDQLIFWQSGFLKLNATIVTTWGVMLVMVLVSLYATRDISGRAHHIGRWQCFLEVIVSYTIKQLRDMGVEDPESCLPFIATLFLFIATSTLGGAVPGVDSPTASLSTTAALAVCVFCAVPFYAVRSGGPAAFFRRYIEPSWILLPFNVTGDLARTISLAVRLFGNAMSETMIVAICLGIAPLFFPVLMKVLGLLTGLIQGYIFAMLATLYIAAGVSRGAGRAGASNSASIERRS